VEHPDTLVVKVNVLEVIELLQYEMRRIIQNIAARVVVNRGEKTLESGAIVEILSRVNFVTEINPRFIEDIKDRPPAVCQLPESGLNQSFRALWPWVNCVPDKRPGKSGVRVKSEISTGFCCIF
jgi:hypothetical protein